MKAFANLYEELDRTTKTTGKVSALKRYFEKTTPADAAWAVYFLSGGKAKRLIQARKLRAWAGEAAEIPDWLLDESYEAVGDLAETIALILPPSSGTSNLPLHTWVEERLLSLRKAAEEEKRRAILQAWRELAEEERFVFNKLITGTFRVGVSTMMLIRALSELSGIDTSIIAGRLSGSWNPTADAYRSLLSTGSDADDLSRPFPFFLAYPLEGEPESLGPVDTWQAEWKWDGIRAQLMRRGGKILLWSRGGEFITGGFPEMEEAGEAIPEGTVLDGEILPWKEGSPLPFSSLQKRVGRKRPGEKILGETPVVFMAFDLLEGKGQDLRGEALAERRRKLEALAAGWSREGPLLISPVLGALSWRDLAEAWGKSRELLAEGLMLKRLSSPYRTGRHRGDWWKWKVNPLTLDTVLLYAEPGHGRRAGLFTDYTFGVWHEGTLVPVAKAYLGLSDEEIRRVDSFIRRNTLEKFGPVRSVTPALVFEIAFEGIQRSSRHKSGVAVRFPRILRIREKRPEEADTLEAVLSLLPAKKKG
ncbi:MAG: ATP-dependent DNA ligase [Deltaproteobacteria bacterium]|nr:ATP-dependent DNA ligase [Deltaproteobacteria bacterium]